MELVSIPLPSYETAQTWGYSNRYQVDGSDSYSASIRWILLPSGRRHYCRHFNRPCSIVFHRFHMVTVVALLLARTNQERLAKPHCRASRGKGFSAAGRGNHPSGIRVSEPRLDFARSTYQFFFSNFNHKRSEYESDEYSIHIQRDSDPDSGTEFMTFSDEDSTHVGDSSTPRSGSSRPSGSDR